MNILIKYLKVVLIQKLNEKLKVVEHLNKYKFEKGLPLVKLSNGAAAY